MLRIATLLIALMWSGAAMAQLAGSPPASGTAGPVGSAASADGLEGAWEGYVACNSKGWAVFVDIRGSAAPYLGRWRFQGGSKGETLAEVREDGAGGYVIVKAEGPDYPFELIEGRMIGHREGDTSCRMALVRALDPALLTGEGG